MWGLSLKAKITLGIPLGVAVVTALGALLIDQRLASGLRQLIQEQQTVLVENVANELDLEMQHAGVQIRHIAQRLAVDNRVTAQGLRMAIADDLDARRIFDNGIYIYTPAGKFVAGYPLNDDISGAELDIRTYFASTTKSDTTTISEPYMSGQQQQHPAVMFTAPVSKDGRLLGLVSGSIDLSGENFLGRLKRARIGKTGYFYLIDLQRTLILHQDASRIMKRDAPRGTNKLLDRALETGFEGTDETITSRGLHSLTTFRRLTSKPWLLGANYPINEAYATLRETRKRLWGGIATLMVLSVIAAHLLARRFMQPVLNLARKIKSLGADPCTGRLEISRDPEIGALAQAFNALLDEQEHRQHDTKRNALLMTTLLDTMPNPIYYKDSTGRYLGCNKAFEQAIGMQRADLVGKTVCDLAPAANAAICDQAEHDLLRVGGVQQNESTVVYADNTQHTVMFVQAKFAHEDGTVGGVLGTYLDFTQLKESERALNQQKEFTESLLQNATVAIFVLDLDHRVKIWNRACEELTGVTAGAMIGTNEQWRGFYCEQRPCLADLVLDQQFEANTTYYETYRQSPINPEGMQAEGWFTLAGCRRYILFTAAPIRDAHGQIIAAIETLEEITYRKEQEDELAAVARAVSIAGGDGFFSAVAHYIGKTLGTDYVLIGSIDEQNPQQLTTLAVAAQDGFASNFTYRLNESPCSGIMNGSICCYPENVRILFPHDQLLQDKGIEGYIAMPLLGTGRVPLGILVAMHRSSIHNPERARSLLKIFAARTAAELQRKIDEDRLRKLTYAVAQSPASIVITDTQGRIEFVNPKFTRVTGYSADEIIGRTPAMLKSGETASTVYHELWDAIEHGSEWEGVFHNRRKDGELYWERAHIGPIKDEQGIITHYIGIKEDITEQKRLEGALRHAQKMEAVGQLAGGIAHDFNNILTAVIGYASILEISAGHDAQMNNGVQQIIKAAERGANLTKSLLAFSRRQAANVQTTDLNEIVVRSEKLLCHLISERIELKISRHPSQLMVNVDGMEIEQVLMNLVTNARDAMPQGGVIVLETGQATVDHQFIKEHGFGIPGQYAVLNVTDNGSGMDQKTADKIFEPFFTTKENGQGTGLGLAIVYNIIKSHKGNIICSSKPGDGTSFTIYLPQLTADLAPAVATPVGLLRQGHELILLVEDETEVRELMRQFLVDYGYRVIIAADGAEAIARFSEKADEIDLVVLDAGLPRVSGSDALAAMRQQRPALKGIIVSGYANNTRITEETGQVTRFLAKPIGPADLVRAVREELDR